MDLLNDRRVIPPWNGIAAIAVAAAVISSFILGYTFAVVGSCIESIAVVMRPGQTELDRARPSPIAIFLISSSSSNVNHHYYDHSHAHRQQK